MAYSNKNLSAAQCLERVIRGNARFASDLRSVKSQPTPEEVLRLSEEGQNPFCIVIADSDSRMPIETIIDCGLGELFVIRTMGAQVDEAAIGSVEYALLNFNCELILILGSAFSASLRVTMESESSPIKKETPAIQKLIKKVKPLLKKSKLRAGYLGDLSNRSSDRDRVIHFASQFMLQQTESEMIQGSRLIQDRVALGLLKIVKGTYGFSTGQISLLADKETKALVSAENIVKEATTLATKANEIIGDINSQHKTKAAS